MKIENYKKVVKINYDELIKLVEKETGESLEGYQIQEVFGDDELEIHMECM